MRDELDRRGLGGSLLAEAEDVLDVVLQKADAAALRQLKAASVAWCAHVRRELCNRLWVRLCRREGQPEPAGVDSITDLDVECLNEAGRPWEVVVAGRQLPQLARLHGWGFVVDVQAVREAGGAGSDGFGRNTLRSCIQGEGRPPGELLLAAVACAASGTVRGIPVQRLRENDAINELDLHESGIRVTAASLLGFMLPAATSLRSLDLAENAICGLDYEGRVRGTYTVAGFNILCKNLKGSAVTSLNLDSNQLCGLYEDDAGSIQGTYTAKAITKLCEGLKGSAVTSLGLYGNFIGAEGASALAAILDETQITQLDLAYNQLCDLDEEGNGTYTAEGITKLCEGLKGSAVSSLDLSDNQFCGHNDMFYTTEVITKLCEALRGSAVTSLNIGRNYIRDEGASALAAVLEETQITTLGLADNDLCGVTSWGGGTYTAKGITKLCEALKGSAVTSLNIWGNKIGEKGVSELAAILKETQIQELDLCGNYIGDKGASALAAVLKETQITNLNIAYNSIGAEGASTLATILKETQIQELDIAYNHIRAEGASALAAVLKETRITKLGLESNDLTNEAKQALQDAAGRSVRISGAEPWQTGTLTLELDDSDDESLPE